MVPRYFAYRVLNLYWGFQTGISIAKSRLTGKSEQQTFLSARNRLHGCATDGSEFHWYAPGGGDILGGEDVLRTPFRDDSPACEEDDAREEIRVKG